MAVPSSWKARILWIALLAAAGYWISTAVWTVQQDEQGVSLRFGRVQQVAQPGMHFTLPWPFGKLIAVSTGEVRTLSVGLEWSEDARLRRQSSEQSQWLTGDTNIVELKVTVLYTVQDPVPYLFGWAGADDAERDQWVRRACESALTMTTPTMPIDELLANGKTVLRRKAQRDMQAYFDALGVGIRITGLNIVEVNPPIKVISAFNEVTNAKSDRERLITEARVYANRMLPEARSAANQKLQQALIYQTEAVNRARGETESFAKLQSELRKGPAMTLRRVWRDALTAILPQVRLQVVQAGTPERPTRVFLEE
ncbi:MAG: FtsH protease activity modulator HflK [Planctomycetota bacterium]|nr:MAG: FtsH protease activity modulator HflK [Planctomycetota bacterium]